MYLKTKIEADEVVILKLVKIEDKNITLAQEEVDKSALNRSVTLQGVSEKADVIFKYTNKY